MIVNICQLLFHCNQIYFARYMLNWQSHQICLNDKWLNRPEDADLKIVFLISSKFLLLVFEVLKQPTLNAYQSSFLRNMASIDTNRLLISTCRPPWAAGEALDVIGRWLGHLLTVSPCCYWNSGRVTLPLLLGHLEFLPFHWRPGRHVQPIRNKEKMKMESGN